MKNILIVLFSLFVLSGCQVLEPFTDGAAEKVAKGVNEYCANSDETFRTEFRTLVNAATAPNAIRVTCAE